MSSPPKPKTSLASSVHQKLSLLTTQSSNTSSSSSSSSSNKPFIKNKSQTTSSINFPSFRFSPESEEIEEIVSGSGGNERRGSYGGDELGAAGGSGGESSTTSGGHRGTEQEPEPSTSSSSGGGGDISPLKEYVLKYKWANKWDKRSLSLDLDLKGKIITAIEDKRRSFVSHFYNEEDEDEQQQQQNQPATPTIITSSHSIPEQLVSSQQGRHHALDDDEDISVHSDTALLRQQAHGNNRTTSVFTNFHEDNCTDYYELYEVDENGSPVLVDPDDLRNLVVEEIGVEALDEDEDQIMEDTSLLKEFVLPPERLQESFAGLPTLYQPPNFVKGLRKYPIQRVATGMTEQQQDDVGGGGEDEVDGQPPQPSSSSIGRFNRRNKPKMVSFRAMIRNMIKQFFYNKKVVYWIAMLAVLVTIDFGKFIGNCMWFGLGAGFIMLFWNLGMEEEEGEDDDDEGSDGGSSDDLEVGEGAEEVPGIAKIGVVKMDELRRAKNNNNGAAATAAMLQERFWQSQGWLLMLPPTGNNSPPGTDYPEYDAFKFHLRNTRVVFVRLIGPKLIISTPHSKHRIPKRRLWNDPTPNNDHIFIRHTQYNLYGAKVEIVPHGLAKKRVWCKKYPIAITLSSKDKYCGKLKLEKSQGVAAGGASTGGANNDDHNNSVSFSKDGSVKLGGAGVGGEDYKGEVYREPGSCAGKTIYLFTRSDREKDDWYRRLVAASKMHMTVSTPPQTPVPFINFIAYMKQACPTLEFLPDKTRGQSPIHASPVTRSPRSTTPTNDLFDSIQPTSQSSPESSKKSTPEKEQIVLGKALDQMITPAFLNAFVARLFYDFLRSPKWTHEVKQLIDRKLFFMRKPAFVQSLKVKELDLGGCLPITNHASAPVLDMQGLWVDLDMTYNGNMVITLEAFVNLLKMGTNDVDKDLEKTGKLSASSSHHHRQHAMFDNEADDSGESSESDDDSNMEMDNEYGENTHHHQGNNSKNADNSGTGTGKTNELDAKGKFFKYADTLAKSSVMRNKHVQKVVTNIAATPLLLTVEIKKVVGTLGVNIPPVPNDRVWLGFRTNPLVEINVKPKVGERVVSLSQVTQWIKNKIMLEFQRVMVNPNMMDITVPLMDFDLPK